MPSGFSWEEKESACLFWLVDCLGRNPSQQKVEKKGRHPLGHWVNAWKESSPSNHEASLAHGPLDLRMVSCIQRQPRKAQRLSLESPWLRKPSDEPVSRVPDFAPDGDFPSTEPSRAMWSVRFEPSIWGRINQSTYSSGLCAQTCWTLKVEHMSESWTLRGQNVGPPQRKMLHPLKRKPKRLPCSAGAPAGAGAPPRCAGRPPGSQRSAIRGRAGRRFGATWGLVNMGNLS